MKPSKILTILELLEDAAYDVGDIMAAMVMAGADRRPSNIKGLIYQLRRSRGNFLIDRLERRRYYELLHKMKRDGLIFSGKVDGRKVFKLTKHGIKKLHFIRKKLSDNSTVSPLPHYYKIDGKDFMIISFDIPEKERQKRKWMRSALREMGFHMVQQSFWAGKVNIPKGFIDDLRRSELLAYIEIFRATRIGSLADEPA